jgi:hypothetical protein
MRNYLSINQLQGVQGVQRLSCVGWGATLKNFFCIFFRMSELHHFGLILKKGEKVVFGAEKCKVLNILIFNKFGR